MKPRSCDLNSFYKMDSKFTYYYQYDKNSARNFTEFLCQELRKIWNLLLFKFPVCFI